MGKPLASGSRKRRWTSLLEIVLGLGFLTDSFAMALLSRFPRFSNPLASVEALASFTLLSSLLLITVIAWLTRARGESLREICLGDLPPRREALLGVSLVPFIFLASFLIKSLARHVFPGIYSGEKNILEELMHSGKDWCLFTVVALVAGGFREELQRAFVIRRFASSGWGPAWLGAALFAAYFGYGHRLQGADEAIIAGILGLVWGLIYARRRNIVANAVSHGLYDALELARYFLWGPLHYL